MLRRHGGYAPSTEFLDALSTLDAHDLPLRAATPHRRPDLRLLRHRRALRRRRGRSLPRGPEPVVLQPDGSFVAAGGGFTLRR